jgi:hypothetical protein
MVLPKAAVATHLTHKVLFKLPTSTLFSPLSLRTVVKGWEDWEARGLGELVRERAGGSEALAAGHDPSSRRFTSLTARPGRVRLRRRH